ncbi:hypothetical protein AWH48_07745 [Domibacillus aminovorans]|uniref:Zinc-ribbon domain-containing protein n=1 Tax=Domibacillus aminovorans TaxID=29332 RepID=A0A177KM84_9BACI|nr:zinc ribbon domain-containing protein [Domibacillus aminovorans]OAH54482.1 hypothetical protein AWH48_07745 [Domibacillus aminovorans]
MQKQEVTLDLSKPSYSKRGNGRLVFDGGDFTAEFPREYNAGSQINISLMFDSGETYTQYKSQYFDFTSSVKKETSRKAHSILMRVKGEGILSFCRQCGHKLDDTTLKFCPSCGMSFHPDPTETNHKPVPPVTRAKAPAQKSKGKQLASLLIIWLVVAGSVFVWYGKKQTDPMNQVEAFEEAAAQKDGKAMAALLTPAVKEMKITDDTGQQLVDYLNENPDVKEEMVKLFKEQAVTKRTADIPEEHPQLILKKGEKKWFFFDTYQYEVQPYYANIHVNFKETAITLDGKSYGTTKEDEAVIKAGPFAPGAYMLVADYKGEYGKEKTERTIDFYESLSAEASFYVEMTGNGVAVTSNRPEAILYVNGESTGKTIREMRKYGPVKRDGSVELSAVYDYPFGSGNAEPVQVKDQEKIHFDVHPDRQDVYEGLRKTIVDHTHEWIQAFENQDTSYFTHVQDDAYFARQRGYYNESSSEGKQWTGSFNYLRFDLDSLVISEENGITYASVDAEVNITGRTYSASSYDGDYIDDTSDFWTYGLKYDETAENWYIVNTTKIDGLSGSNIETIR